MKTSLCALLIALGISYYVVYAHLYCPWPWAYLKRPLKRFLESPAAESTWHQQLDQSEVIKMLQQPCVFDDQSALHGPEFGRGKRLEDPWLDVQEHPVLLDFIRTHVIQPVRKSSNVFSTSDCESSSTGVLLEDPSPSEVMRHLIIPRFFSAGGIAGRPKSKTYVECGVLNTAAQSMTYYLEKELGWSELLVEPSDQYGPHRNPVENAAHFGRFKSKVAMACLAPQRKPCKAYLTTFSGKAGDLAYINHTAGKATPSSSSLSVSCYPLTSLLLAAGLTEVDFLSLDVELAELYVLPTVNWEIVRPKVFRIDNHSHVQSPRILQAIHSALNSNGYHHHSWLVNNTFMPPWDSHFYTLMTDSERH